MVTNTCGMYISYAVACTVHIAADVNHVAKLRNHHTIDETHISFAFAMLVVFGRSQALVTGAIRRVYGAFLLLAQSFRLR